MMETFARSSCNHPPSVVKYTLAIQVGGVIVRTQQS